MDEAFGKDAAFGLFGGFGFEDLPICVELLRRDLYLRDGLRFDRRVLSGTELTVMY